MRGLFSYFAYYFTKHYMKKLLLASVVLAAITLQLSSCVKKKFDTPPDTNTYDPQLTVTHTIEQIKRFPVGVAIDSNAVISGIVVMDDRSGNYYKKMVIQDSTGGIEVLVDQNNLYNDYPVGRKVYVQLKGLFIGEYGQNKQLGYTPDASGSVSNIPFVEAGKYIIKANYPNPVVADTFTVAELSNVSAMQAHLNTLIAIKDVEFADDAVGAPYAQLASLASATNRTIKDCNGSTITLRTSGYANFQPLSIPGGRGIIVGIYTRFNNTPQLYIRDTSDVRLRDSIRCNGSVYRNPELISIDSLRKYYTGSEVVLPNLKIRGIVISDASNGNVSAGNVVLQGGNNDKGIVLYFGGNPNYNVGDSIEVNVTGATLKEYRGKLELENVSTSKTTRLSAGRTITPRTVTISEIAANVANYESTLVRIANVTWDASYTTINGDRGNLNVSDATGTILHYTANGASFKEFVLPPSPATAIVGIIERYNTTIQLRIRNTGDITP